MKQEAAQAASNLAMLADAPPPPFKEQAAPPFNEQAAASQIPQAAARAPPPTAQTSISREMFITRVNQWFTNHPSKPMAQAIMAEFQAVPPRLDHNQVLAKLSEFLGPDASASLMRSLHQPATVAPATSTTVGVAVNGQNIQVELSAEEYAILQSLPPERRSEYIRPRVQQMMQQRNPQPPPGDQPLVGWQGPGTLTFNVQTCSVTYTASDGLAINFPIDRDQNNRNDMLRKLVDPAYKNTLLQQWGKQLEGVRHQRTSQQAPHQGKRAADQSEAPPAKRPKYAVQPSQYAPPSGGGPPQPAYLQPQTRGAPAQSAPVPRPAPPRPALIARPPPPASNAMKKDSNFSDVITNNVDLAKERDLLQTTTAATSSDARAAGQQRDVWIVPATKLSEIIGETTKKHGLQGVDPKVLEYMNLALRERLINMLEDLRKVAIHRGVTPRTHGGAVVKQDIRKLLRKKKNLAEREAEKKLQLEAEAQRGDARALRARLEKASDPQSIAMLQQMQRAEAEAAERKRMASSNAAVMKLVGKRRNKPAPPPPPLSEMEEESLKKLEDAAVQAPLGEQNAAELKRLEEKQSVHKKYLENKKTAPKAGGRRGGRTRRGITSRDLVYYLEGQLPGTVNIRMIEKIHARTKR